MTPSPWPPSPPFQFLSSPPHQVPIVSRTSTSATCWCCEQSLKQRATGGSMNSIPAVRGMMQLSRTSSYSLSLLPSESSGGGSGFESYLKLLVCESLNSEPLLVDLCLLFIVYFCTFIFMYLLCISCLLSIFVCLFSPGVAIAFLMRARCLQETLQSS